MELAVTYLFGAGCLQWRQLEDALQEIERVMGRNPGAMYPLRPTVERLIRRLIREGAVDLDQGGLLGRMGFLQPQKRIKLNHRAANYISPENFQRIREDILQGRYRTQEEMYRT